MVFEGQSHGRRGKRPNQICRAGMGRTFQVVRPFARMSVADNVMIGAAVGRGHA